MIQHITKIKKQIIHRWMLMAAFYPRASFIGINAREENRASLQRYTQQNAELPKPEKNEKRVVFIGNPVTEGWVNTHPDFLRNDGCIDRGIGRRTSYQFLVCFREDVISLPPVLVVISAAIDDIAENIGTYHEDRTFGGTVSIMELAKVNHIKVILAIALPTADFDWNPSARNAPRKIASLGAAPKSMRQSKQGSICRLLFIDDKR